MNKQFFNYYEKAIPIRSIANQVSGSGPEGKKTHKNQCCGIGSGIQDPGSDNFLSPGSGIRNGFFSIPDPNPIFF
jgi:hypothetical protein